MITTVGIFLLVHLIFHNNTSHGEYVFFSLQKSPFNLYTLFILLTFLIFLDYDMICIYSVN